MSTHVVGRRNADGITRSHIALRGILTAILQGPGPLSDYGHVVEVSASSILS